MFNIFKKLFKKKGKPADLGFANATFPKMSSKRAELSVEKTEIEKPEVEKSYPKKKAKNVKNNFKKDPNKKGKGRKSYDTSRKFYE